MNIDNNLYGCFTYFFIKHPDLSTGMNIKYVNIFT